MMMTNEKLQKEIKSLQADLQAAHEKLRQTINERDKLSQALREEMTRGAQDALAARIEEAQEREDGGGG